MAKRKVKLTQARLREICTYDPETGEFSFVRKKGSGGRQRVGWCDYDGYKLVQIDGRSYRLHRLAWLYVHGEHPHVVDHLNGDPGDNRLYNLRNTDYVGNRQNYRVRTEHGARRYGWPVGTTLRSSCDE